MPETINNLLSHKATISLLVITCLLIVRIVLVGMIRRRSESEVLNEQQRRWISWVKNGVISLILFSLIALWWPELRQFALSIAAVAVAFVIASKELILCISGTVLRTTSGASSVGDWIEIGDIRGEVTDQNILSTVIQEIDSSSCTYRYTGKTVTLPNSVFLTQPVKNMNFMRRFVFHSFTIVTEPDVNVFEARQTILNKTRIYCDEFMELGKRYHSFIIKRSGIDIPSPEPAIYISTTDLGKNAFSVILFCPTQQAAELEQKITEDLLTFYYAQKKR